MRVNYSSSHTHIKGLLHSSRHVHICSSLVNDQDLVLPEKGSSQAHQLSLAHTKVRATFRHNCLQLTLHVLYGRLQLDLWGDMYMHHIMSHDCHMHTPSPYLLKARPNLLIAVLPKWVQVVPHTATEEHRVLKRCTVQRSVVVGLVMVCTADNSSHPDLWNDGDLLPHVMQSQCSDGHPINLHHSLGLSHAEQSLHQR